MRGEYGSWWRKVFLGMSEPAERGRERLVRAMADLNVPATDFALAYRTLHRAQIEDNADEETFSWVVSCMRELVAHCELYLRDNPQDWEIIEHIIERILDEREVQEEE
jgi:hypothetical protein